MFSGKKRGAMKMLQKVIKQTPATFINKPEVTISGKTFRRPLPYARAFGGVALGSMNAQEQARVAGIRAKLAELLPRVASSGSIMLDMATLDTNSVANVVTAVISRGRTNLETWSLKKFRPPSMYSIRPLF